MKKNRQLLVVSAEDRKEVLTFQLPEGWQAAYACGLDEGLKQLKNVSPDMVLLDLPVADIPDEAIALARELPETAFVPILPKADSKTILKCFRQGAYDVVTCRLHGQALDGLFERFEEFSTLQRENRHYRHKLEKANRELRDSLKILELDQKAGRQVQQSMLPKTPIRRGEYEISYSIVPSLYLSGDFIGYDIVFGRYMLFYLADVSGHGASSAFITILLRFFLKRIIRRHIVNNDYNTLARAPEGFLEYVNRRICELNLDKHLTIFAGAIDMQTNILRYSVGAHLPAPIFLSGEEDARFMQGKGKPIGLFPDATWQVEEIALPEKFMLTITSDGVLEFIGGDSLQDKLKVMLNAVAKSNGTLEHLLVNLGVEDLENAPDDVTVLTVTRGY